MSHIQWEFPHNWIICFLAVYKCLTYLLTVSPSYFQYLVNVDCMVSSGCRYRGRLDQGAAPAGWKWKNEAVHMWAPLNRAICERSKEEKRAGQSNGHWMRSTRRLGSEKYLIVQKRKLEGEWGSGGSRRAEGRGFGSSEAWHGCWVDGCQCCVGTWSIRQGSRGPTRLSSTGNRTKICRRWANQWGVKGTCVYTIGPKRGIACSVKGWSPSGNHQGSWRVQNWCSGYRQWNVSNDAVDRGCHGWHCWSFCITCVIVWHLKQL